MALGILLHLQSYVGNSAQRSAHVQREREFSRTALFDFSCFFLTQTKFHKKYVTGLQVIKLLSYSNAVGLR